MVVCPRWEQESWYQCWVRRMPPCSNRSLLLPRLKPQCGFGSAIWHVVTRGCAGGFRAVVCFGRGPVSAWAMRAACRGAGSCHCRRRSPVHPLPRKRRRTSQTQTSAPMRRPCCCIDVWLMRVGVQSCLSLALEHRTALGWAPAFRVMLM